MEERYGRLLTTGEIFDKKDNIGRTRKWIFAICDCGVKRDYRIDSLKYKHATSCGCYNREQSKKESTKHGLRSHPLWNIWSGMRGRCYNTKGKRYPEWGGRGIKICDDWYKDFKSFYDWAINNGYKKGLSLDRYPNNNGNYEPTNCRWATCAQQSQNRRTTKITAQRAKHIRILYKGGLKTQKQIAGLYGIGDHVVSKVITNRSWSESSLSI